MAGIDDDEENDSTGAAVRLMFEYRDGEFVPIAPQRVQMIPPHPPATRAETSGEGRFVELRSAAGEPVQSVRVGEPGPPNVEFPTGDPEQPFGRTEPPPGAIISVVVEPNEQATHAALVDVSTRRGQRGLAKRDLAIVALPPGDGQ